MNWEQLAAIAEIVGAIAVVVTLLYLAREIRHNSRSLAVAALRDTTSNWNDWSNMLAGSADLADIVARGNRELARLGEAEVLRYLAYVQSFFDIVESHRALVVEHRIDRDIDVLRTVVARRMANPGLRQGWRAIRNDYESGFVAWVDAIGRDKAAGSPGPESGAGKVDAPEYE